jgi:hypothetical protein
VRDINGDNFWVVFVADTSTMQKEPNGLLNVLRIQSVMKPPLETGVFTSS